MMKTTVTLCSLLLLCSCAQHSAQPGKIASPTVNTVDPLHISRLLKEPSNMIMLEQFPASDNISDVTIARGINTKQVTPLTVDNFAALLNSAKALDPTDEKIRVWHYAPWHTVTFSGPEGQYRMSLFLGGRGFLLLPSGSVGPFEFVHPK